MQNLGPKQAVAEPKAQKAWLRYILFSARCAGAAAASQALATWMGLSFPVWATLSALVVSQERLEETRSSLMGRLLGTVVGMVIAVAVYEGACAFGMVHENVQAELLAASAISAAVARRWPMARASMWTAVIVLVSPREGASIPAVALWRGVEVALGGLCGGGAHYLAEKAMLMIEHQGEKLPSSICRSRL